MIISEKKIKQNKSDQIEKFKRDTQGMTNSQKLEYPSVYVLSMRGKPLMPTSPGKARMLLKKDKAKVVKRVLLPFS